MANLTPAENDLLARIKDKVELRPFFFRKAKGLKWFDALNQDGYFSPSENPMPVPAKEEGYVNIPFWAATEYLAASSPELLETRNVAYAENVLNIVRSVTQDAIERNFSNYRTWWQFSKIIRNIPPHLIADTDLALVDYWLDDKYERGLVAENLGEHWLVSLLERNDEHCRVLAAGLLRTLYKFTLIDKPYGDTNRKEAILRFDSWHARKLTKKTAAKVGEILGPVAVEIFRTGLEQILESLNNDKWSAIWRSSIEDHEQNHSSNDAENIFIEGMRDALLAHVEETLTSATPYVAELLDSPFETTRRVAIYTIDKHYQQLSELIEQVLVDRHFTSNFRHELWHLLHNRYSQFSEQNKTLVQEIISAQVAQVNDGQQSDGTTAYKRAIWLSAIKDYGDDVAISYRKCIDIIGHEPEQPDFSSYMTSGFVDHKTPIPKDELLSMEVGDLVSRLNTYVDPGRFGEPGIEGLVKAFRQMIKTEPVRYFNQLRMFANLDLAYIYELLEAYGELWTEKAQLPWEEIWAHLLEFCAEIVKHDEFWSAENAEERRSFVANRYWIVGSIGRLIENGTRADENAFSEKYLDQARSILLVLLEKEKGETFTTGSDPVSISINSPRGRCLEAYINLSLRTCRLSDKHNGNHDDAWKMLVPTYNAELLRADNGEFEFATLVVNYLPNFLYMSKEWVMDNLDSIFDLENYQKWLCAMNGYAYVGTVYEGIYDHLKRKGHFIKALNDENIKDRLDEKIIQNIAVAYINDFENLEDDTSLIFQLLARRQTPELSQLIWFMWTLRKEGDVQIQSKVFALWPRLLDVIDTNTREGKKLASRLCSWAVFIDELNGNNRPLILSVALFADEDYNSHDLLEMIARISLKQPSEAHELWLRLLEGSSPDFPEEAVRTALTNLVQIGAEGVRNAKDIVSKYLKNGNDRPSQWLNEIVAKR